MLSLLDQAKIRSHRSSPSYGEQHLMWTQIPTPYDGFMETAVNDYDALNVDKIFVDQLNRDIQQHAQIFARKIMNKEQVQVDIDSPEPYPCATILLTAGFTVVRLRFRPIMLPRQIQERYV